jgi:hypothetical protein
MASTPMDSIKVKLSGLINTCLAANRTPTAEAKEAPTAKPSNFILTTVSELVGYGTALWPNALSLKVSIASGIAAGIGAGWLCEPYRY